MEIFFRMTAGRVRGYVTGLESFSLDESLRYRLLKRPVKWCVFGMALLITGLISLAVISDQYHTISLKAAYSFKTRGPRVISSAEESLSIHTSGVVLFDNFRIYSTSPSGSDFVLFDPSEDKYKYLQEDLLGEIAEAREFWDSFIREISGMFRYADGSSVNFRDKSIHSFQSLPILCTRPDAFIEYIRSRDIRYIEQMNPRSLEVTVHNNSDCRYFLDSLVREVKYELYFSMAYYADRSRLVIPDEYEYPLFFQKTGYSFIRPVNNPNLDSNILFTGYFDELMDAALLRLGSERLLNGLYFVETPVGPGYPEGVEGIGFSEAFELEEFCVLLIIPMVYLVSALMLLVSALFRIFRDY
ncbi:MAG: hypothetical protein PQJ50_05950 [Spirochaetales bacterium]|nr:hypothetical protein [Spirochaetales bacterium]